MVSLRSEPSAAIDAEDLETRTQDLRALDRRSGGGSCLDEVVTLIHRVHNVTPAQTGRQRLDVAIADLHNLAGWACFDIGLTSRAEVYFSQALALAGRGHSDQLVADVLYRLGRLRLHAGRRPRWSVAAWCQLRDGSGRVIRRTELLIARMTPLHTTTARLRRCSCDRWPVGPGCRLHR